MKKTLILLFCVALNLQTLVFAQINSEMRTNIERALLSYFNTYGGENYSLLSFREKAYTFGFVISINEKGKVDNVVFSNKTKKLDSLVSFANIENRIRQISGFESVKNTNLVGLVLVRRKQDATISNFYDAYSRRQYNEKQDFDEYFTDMMPVIPPKSNSRRILLLPAFGLVQMPSVR